MLSRFRDKKVDRDWLRDPRVYDPDTQMPHYRLDAKQRGLLMAFLGNKTDPDFLGNRHFDPPHFGPDRPRPGTGQRTRMRRVS